MDNPSLPARIVLIGPSGSGKSELASRLAKELAYEPVDTDALIEERIGMPVFEFFARFGEPAFRAVEHQILDEVCKREHVVIATGGGAVTVEANWTAMRPNAAIVCLRASPETLVQRVNAQAAGGSARAVRPLLAGDALQRIREQLSVRDPLYEQADYTVDTDELSPENVTDAAKNWLVGSPVVPSYTLPGMVDRSDIYIGRGVSGHLARIVRRRWPKSRRVWVITDDNVGPLWAGKVASLFEAEGISATSLTVPAGEASKSFLQVERLCDQMTSQRASRRDVVVALGGGVVGDLAGLVATICLRGLSLVQVPTSLLAMVDSSVGGKTGINLPSGKNLVGSFNQPSLVFVDSEFLGTLPSEEYRSGMAEVIKHSIIQPTTPRGGQTLGATLERTESLAPLPTSTIDEVLKENVGIKHSVVQADERESGLRMILNFGHTTGHAIEADGYRYRHGEAVGLGMLVAGHMALELERVDRRWLDNLTSLLQRAQLLIRFEGRADDVVERLASDKKNVDGNLHWVMPSSSGGVEVVQGIDVDLVKRALRDIGAV